MSPPNPRFAAGLLLALVALAACAPVSWDPGPGLPGDLVREDAGTVTGSWREMLRDGKGVRSGYALSIGVPSPMTFAAQKGCIATGGVLEPIGNDRYRIARYNGGIRASEECPPWRADPRLAPFDSGEVLLVRKGARLLASGGGHTAELRRITLQQP